MDSLRVLLVDQDVEESERVAGRLEQADHTVLPAAGLEEAAQALEIQGFDAVVVSSRLVNEQLRVFRCNLISSGRSEKKPIQIPLICYAATPSEQPCAAELARCQVDACLPQDFEAQAFSQIISALAAEILARQATSADCEAPALPIFEAADFQEQLDFDRDLVNEILDLYLTDSTQQLTGMRIALESQDLLTLSRIAHSIKGSLGSLHALEAASRAQTLEEIAKDGDAVRSAAAFAQLERALLSLEPELRQLRHAEPGS